MPLNRISPIRLTSVDISDIDVDTWTPFDLDDVVIGLDGACTALRIDNSTNYNVFLSYNGVDEHEYIPKLTSISINFQLNSAPSGRVAKVRNKTILYIKTKVAFKGQGPEYVYLSGYYN